MPPSSSKSDRNPNQGVVPNTVKTICKPKFQGAANNILQKGAFTQRPTRKSNIIAKARKPNHVFRIRVGLSSQIYTFDKYNCQTRQIVNFCEHVLVS